MVKRIPTADVLRAIRLMLSTADEREDSDNDTHHRKIAPAEEGWNLPRDLTKKRHRGYPKACAPTATTRLRNRLEAWEIIETTPGQRKDSKGRLLENPPIFIRLRRDAAGIRKIEMLLIAADSIHHLKPLPGLSKHDLDSQGNLAVLQEWSDSQEFLHPRADAALDALYVRYRYHALALRRLNVEGFAKRLAHELDASTSEAALTLKAIREHSKILAGQQSQNKRENPENGAGIKLSRKNPPGQTLPVIV